MDHNWVYFDWGNSAFEYSICSVCDLIKAVAYNGEIAYLEYNNYEFGMRGIDYTEKLSCNNRMIEDILE